MRFSGIPSLLIVMVIMLLSGCVRHVMDEPPPVIVSPPGALMPVDAAELDFDDDLDSASLLLAIERSMAYFQGIGRDQVFMFNGREITARDMKASLTAFARIIQTETDPQARKERIIEEFDVYRAGGAKGDGAVMFTGYYEPLLEGSLWPTDQYPHPIYRTPPDLIMQRVSPTQTRIGRMEDGQWTPYYTRREIDIDGVLKNRDLELLWVSCPVELATLHIQGSGKVMLDGGMVLSVSYAQNNGWPFRSVTTRLLDTNQITRAESGYRSFKRFLKSKTDPEIFEMLSFNERYIFFRFVDGEPLGSLGEPVTPDRSIATDPEFFPQGALAFIRMRKPLFDEEGNITRRIGFSRFVLNQDKGSAIKGAGRVDLFCGFGDQAQSTAGTIKEYGELYFLIKR